MTNKKNKQKKQKKNKNKKQKTKTSASVSFQNYWEEPESAYYSAYSYRLIHVVCALKRKPAVAGIVVMRTCRGQSCVIMSNKSRVNDTMPLFPKAECLMTIFCLAVRE